MASVLEVEAVTAGYAGVPIIHDFSFALATGSITTLIGGDGGGKSMTMSAIYGACQQFSGSVKLLGQAIDQLPPWERYKRGIGFVPQGRCNFPRMTVWENLNLGCYILEARQHDAALQRVLAMFPMLQRKLKEKAGNLSGGEQQILETAMVLLTEPKLLLLDEPSLGLSPKTQAEVFAIARSIAASGVTILVVEQNVHGALLIHDTAIAYLGGNISEETV